jgi:hypothetical protein
MAALSPEQWKVGTLTSAELNLDAAQSAVQG